MRKRASSVFAETSKQSKAQMPLLINTQYVVDVYPGQSREKKPAKAGEIHAPQTRDFLGEGVAGNGFCKFLLLITTSQTKSEETFFLLKPYLNTATYSRQNRRCIGWLRLVSQTFMKHVGKS